MFAVLGFKIHITRTFLPAFQYYIPTDEELRQAAVHSKRSDNLNNKLEKRFGHPALHQDLFTPMVHANMTHLLAEVFDGKIGSTKTALDDFGGNKVDAAVVGGVRIAGIEEVGNVNRILWRALLMYVIARSGVRSAALPAGSRRARLGPAFGVVRDDAERQRLRGAAQPHRPRLTRTLQNRRVRPVPRQRAPARDRDGTPGLRPTAPPPRCSECPFSLPHLSRVTETFRPQQAPGYYEADMASRSALSLSQYGGGSPYGTPQMEFAPPMPPQMAAPAAFETGAEQGYRQAPVYRPTPPRDGAWQ